MKTGNGLNVESDEWPAARMAVDGLRRDWSALAAAEVRCALGGRETGDRFRQPL